MPSECRLEFKRKKGENGAIVRLAGMMSSHPSLIHSELYMYDDFFSFDEKLLVVEAIANGLRSNSVIKSIAFWTYEGPELFSIFTEGIADNKSLKCLTLYPLDRMTPEMYNSLAQALQRNSGLKTIHSRSYCNFRSAMHVLRGLSGNATIEEIRTSSGPYHCCDNCRRLTEDDVRDFRDAVSSFARLSNLKVHIFLSDEQRRLEEAVRSIMMMNALKVAGRDYMVKKNTPEIGALVLAKVSDDPHAVCFHLRENAGVFFCSDPPAPPTFQISQKTDLQGSEVSLGAATRAADHNTPVFASQTIIKKAARAIIQPTQMGEQDRLGLASLPSITTSKTGDTTLEVEPNSLEGTTLQCNVQMSGKIARTVEPPTRETKSILSTMMHRSEQWATRMLAVVLSLVRLLVLAFVCVYLVALIQVLADS
jgi:hypothetical protein